ncbi:hypothetical protein EBZ80_24360 [bacterium]|nr:hypothetical protein [bacterium]
MDRINENMACAITEAFKNPDEDHDIFFMATQLVYCLRTEGEGHLLIGFWKDVYPENREETLEWMDSLDGEPGEKWRKLRGELLAAQPIASTV